jgi:hypothetical protein
MTIRNLISSLASAALIASAIAIPTFSFATSANAGEMACLADGSANNWSIHWVRGGTGRCPGHILAADAAKLVKQADSAKAGATLWVRFQIPEKCPASGVAKVPVKVNADQKRLDVMPWNKTCIAK